LNRRKLIYSDLKESAPASLGSAGRDPLPILVAPDDYAVPPGDNPFARTQRYLLDGLSGLK